MKSFTALVLVLLCCRCSAGQCVEITARALPETKPSSRNAKITVLLSGKPQAKVKIVVSLPAGQGSRSFVTDSDGSVMLKDLPKGMSCVKATAESNLADEVCLQVPAHSNNEVSSVYMAFSAPLPTDSFENKVKRAEQSDPSQRLRRLAGTLVDANGAVIPGADIQVYRRGKYLDGAPATFKTNDVGRFKASLEPGIYTVIFRMFGFEREFVEVEISPEGSERELYETLQVAVFDRCN